MSSIYPIVTLSEVIQMDIDRVDLVPGTEYPMVGVYSYARGLFTKESVRGEQSSYKYFFRLNPQHIVMSKLFGWEGAVALSSEQFAGLFVSSQFPTFTCDTSKIERDYLKWCLQLPTLWDQLGDQATGMGDRRRTLKQDALLNCKIPLPPLEDQKRIVAHIEALAHRIEEARGLRQGAIEDAEALISAELNQHVKTAYENDSKFITIGEVTSYSRYGPRFYNQSYSEYGTRIMRATDIDSTGRANYKSMPRMAVDTEDIEKLKLQVGDLAIVRSGSIGLMAVHDNPDVDCIPGAYFIQFRFSDEINPHYIRYCLQSPLLLEELAGRGTAIKNLNANKIKSAQIPFYTPLEQSELVSYFRSLEERILDLHNIQKQSEQQLEALLPSILDKAFKGEL